MEFDRLERMTRIVSMEKMEALRQGHVMLFGLGGVGSFSAEAVARMGFGKITIVDCDVVTISNMNRQLPAILPNIGRRKTEAVAERLAQIAPDAVIRPIEAKYLPDHPVVIPQDVTIVLDAIDTVSAKIHIAQVCWERNLPLVSCMGMGNRLDPTQIKIGDLFETSGCPLCRVMRHELRKRRITALRCVYSTEESIKPKIVGVERALPGSVAFVPSVAGLYMAYEAFRLA